jgi:hypothetical protein
VGLRHEVAEPAGPERGHQPVAVPEASVWTVLREAAMGSPRSELVRERREAASWLRLLRSFVGYATSLAACGDDDDLEEALREALQDVQAYLARKRHDLR